MDPSRRDDAVRPARRGRRRRLIERKRGEVIVEKFSAPGARQLFTLRGGDGLLYDHQWLVKATFSRAGIARSRGNRPDGRAVDPDDLTPMTTTPSPGRALADKRELGPRPPHRRCNRGYSAQKVARGAREQPSRNSAPPKSRRERFML